MFEQSEKIDALAKALASAQAEIGNAKKDAKNPHFKNTYASLTEVLDVAKVINKYGLSVTQWPLESGRLCTTLMHESGQWVRATMSVPLAKNDPQGAGSALTYMRRYALKSILGIGDEDDDAEAAKGSVKQEAAKASVKQEETKPSIDLFKVEAKKANGVSKLFAQLLEKTADADAWAMAWEDAKGEEEKTAVARQLFNNLNSK